MKLKYPFFIRKDKRVKKKEKIVQKTQYRNNRNTKFPNSNFTSAEEEEVEGGVYFLDHQPWYARSLS